MKISYIKMKRGADIALAFIALCLCWPFMLLIALGIKLFDPGGPVIYRQMRPGYKGRLFCIYKFRTMKTESRRVEDGVKTRIPDRERVTRIGAALRRTSLDELPQLFNILAGDMSFIGPRPLLTRYLRQYSKEQMRRHDVLPGISGLAQVSGRNAIEWDEKFVLDIYYVDNINLGLDIKILLLTIKNVIRGSGVNNSDNETMPFFKGKGERL